MRQKLALAVTLAVDTPLVILDEPTSNLDPTVRSDVAALVLEAKQAGRTVIFSSHVISEVEQVCDRAVILRQGRVVYTQVIADLLRKH
jgi:ABC-2 type transport system ATP-binding protein